MPTKEESKAKQKLANVKARVRLLLVDGKIKDAEDYAATNGIGVFDARLGPEYKHSTEATFLALEALYKAEADGTKRQADEAAAEAAAAAPAPEANFDETPAQESLNGWPINVSAKIWGFPPNKNLVVIALPDGRKASMYKGRGNAFRIHDKVDAKLVKSEGDPIYESVIRPRY